MNVMRDMQATPGRMISRPMLAPASAGKKQSSLFLFSGDPVHFACGTAASRVRLMVSEKPFLPALPLAELAPGAMRCVTLGDAPVLLVHTREGGVHAVHNICSHAYAKMDEGRLRGYRVICPLHGASFDVRNGAVLGAPASAPLQSYPVRVVDGHIMVQA